MQQQPLQILNDLENPHHKLHFLDVSPHICFLLIFLLKLIKARTAFSGPVTQRDGMKLELVKVIIGTTAL